MKFSDIEKLKEHYKSIADEAAHDVERLEGEIEDSKQAISTAEKDAVKAAESSDFKSYQSANNKVNMHRQRIGMHKKKVAALNDGHLISEEEFNRVSGELAELEKNITREAAARFMQALDEIKAITAEYVAMMETCTSFGRLLQEKVYRKRDPFMPGRMQVRTSMRLPAFEQIVNVFDLPNNAWSLPMATIKQWAASFHKSEDMEPCVDPDKAGHEQKEYSS